MVSTAASLAPVAFGEGRLTPAVVADLDPFELAAAVGALSRRDVEALDRSEAEALVVACERITTAVAAREALAMEALAGRVEDDLLRAQELWSGGRVGPGTHGLVAATLSPALHCATRTATHRLVGARRLVCEFESIFDAVWDGDLERHRADVVVEAGLALDPQLRARFEALVLESSLDEVTGEFAVLSPRVRGLSRSELSARATAIARELDPASEHEAMSRAREARRVVVRPDRDHPGMARWVAILPTDTSQRMAAAVDALAAQYSGGSGTPIDAARADALSDLVLANADISTTVELLVPTLPGCHDARHRRRVQRPGTRARRDGDAGTRVRLSHHGALVHPGRAGRPPSR